MNGLQVLRFIFQYLLEKDNTDSKEILPLGIFHC